MQVIETLRSFSKDSTTTTTKKETESLKGIDEFEGMKWRHSQHVHQIPYREFRIANLKH